MTNILLNLIVVIAFLCVSCETAAQSDIALVSRKAEFQRFSPGIVPVFYFTNNLDAADTVSTDEVWPGGSVGLDLDGSNMTVGEWDGGAIYAEHPNFTGHLTQVDGVTPVGSNSPHVAGSLTGSGKPPKILYVIPRRD